MKSRTTRRFREALALLPPEVRDRAQEAYRLFSTDHRHPSLRFKKIHPAEAIYSVRVTRQYRGLGVLEGDTIVWFWVGSHAEYDRLIQRGV